MRANVFDGGEKLKGFVERENFQNKIEETFIKFQNFEDFFKFFKFFFEFS